MEKLKKDRDYMAQHSGDYEQRFGRTEMRHLRKWWISQRYAYENRMDHRARTGQRNRLDAAASAVLRREPRGARGRAHQRTDRKQPRGGRDC